MGYTCLKHIIEQIQLDNRLALDQMIHHGSVDVAHDVDTEPNDEALEQVNDLSWEQKPAA